MAKSDRTTPARGHRTQATSRIAGETRRMGKLAAAASDDVVASTGTMVAELADSGRSVARAALGQAKVWRNEVGAAVGRRPFMSIAGAVMAGMIAALIVGRR